MKDYYLYELCNYDIFEKNVLMNLKKEKFIVMCIGTKRYNYDSFAVLLGDKLKKLKIYSFGSSLREINGENYLLVYNFLKKKFPKYKILILDSVYCLNKNKPLLIFKNNPINVSGINSKVCIGDYGILFNSFSYTDKYIIDNIMNLLTKTFFKLCQNN